MRWPFLAWIGRVKVTDAVKRDAVPRGVRAVALRVEAMAGLRGGGKIGNGAGLPAWGTILNGGLVAVAGEGGAVFGLGVGGGAAGAGFTAPPDGSAAINFRPHGQRTLRPLSSSGSSNSAPHAGQCMSMIPFPPLNR